MLVSFCGEGPRSRSYKRTAALRLLVQPCDEDESWSVFFIFPCNGTHVEWNWQEKTEVLGGKTCPSATLSATNTTWTDPGSNPGLRGGRPATNRLNHGTANVCQLGGRESVCVPRSSYILTLALVTFKWLKSDHHKSHLRVFTRTSAV
jgi:hypothetical protein